MSHGNCLMEYQCAICTEKCGTLKRLIARIIPMRCGDCSILQETADEEPVLDTDIGNAYQMHPDDWTPLIDAMAFLKHNPKCGDVAKQLESMFREAKKGKYYYIEMGYESDNGEPFIVGMDFGGYEEIK